MTDYAYKDRDGQIVLVHDGVQTTLASQEGDTVAHQQLAVFLDGGGEIAEEAPFASLEDAKAARLNQLTADCSTAIVGGYQSDALGASHHYPSGMVDQINMMGSVTASLLPDLADGWQTPFWCRAANGSWAFRAHTASQIQQAGRDGKAHVVICQATLEGLAQLVSEATSIEDVAAVTWQLAGE